MDNHENGPGVGFDVGIVLLMELIAGVFIGVVLYFMLFPSQIKDQMCMFFLGMGYAAVVLSLLLNTYERVCPACNRVGSRAKVSTQEVDRRKGYKTIEREEKNRSGDVIRRWNEQIRVLTVTYEDHYLCRNCSQTWKVRRQSEYDSFDE